MGMFLLVRGINAALLRKTICSAYQLIFGDDCIPIGDKTARRNCSTNTDFSSLLRP
jgi:hypothetical protein